MNRPTHAGLRHLALNVRELDEMKRFYVDLLGFEVEWEPDSDNIYLSSGIDNLALHRSTPPNPESLTAGRSKAPNPESLTAGRAAGPGGSESDGTQALDHLGL